MGPNFFEKTDGSKVCKLLVHRHFIQCKTIEQHKLNIEKPDEGLEQFLLLGVSNVHLLSLDKGFKQTDPAAMGGALDPFWLAVSLINWNTNYKGNILDQFSIISTRVKY